jgi:hypothetical protein
MSDIIPHFLFHYPEIRRQLSQTSARWAQERGSILMQGIGHIHWLSIGIRRRWKNVVKRTIRNCKQLWRLCRCCTMRPDSATKLTVIFSTSSVREKKTHHTVIQSTASSSVSPLYHYHSTLGFNSSNRSAHSTCSRNTIYGPFIMKNHQILFDYSITCCK